MENEETKNRTCLECGEELHGRIDKRYCDDLCRNAHHNRMNRQRVNLVRTVNRILSKNRRILAELNPGEKSKSHRNKLLQKGFNFTYYTHTYTTKAGAVYYFCYDKGYLPLDNEWLALVTNEELR